MTEASISAAPTFGIFDSGDGPLAYRDAGPRDGHPLVLLHSGFVDHTEFDDLIPAFAAAGYRVIAPDARGHGWSANASRPFRQTDDLAALLRHLDLGEPAVLAGVSMGGMIGIDTAAEHPELVRALLISGRGLCQPDPADDPWYAAMVDAQHTALAAGDIPAWQDAFAAFATGPTRTVAELDAAMLGRIKEMALRTLLKHTPDEDPALCVPVPGLTQRLDEFTLPVLALNGALDSPACLNTVTKLMDGIPHGRTLTLPGTGHYTSLERPEEFTRTLLDFLTEVHA
ncbi:alpha/beta hydrolase [Kitasatospora sp. NPDC049285]|uniref:alpha/beta fold hydrolase n=1 Tax=Kitasatospora sp. NPDC049285 TaxID=3157096 RepID=UPI00342F8C1C